MEEAIRRALEKSEADYAEVRLERASRSQVLFRKDKLENLERSVESGGIVRCLKDGGWGIAVFNDVSELPEKVAEATRFAKLVSRHSDEEVRLASVDPVQ